MVSKLIFEKGLPLLGHVTRLVIQNIFISDKTEVSDSKGSMILRNKYKSQPLPIDQQILEIENDKIEIGVETSNGTAAVSDFAEIYKCDALPPPVPGNWEFVIFIKFSFKYDIYNSSNNKPRQHCYICNYM